MNRRMALTGAGAAVLAAGLVGVLFATGALGGGDRSALEAKKICGDMDYASQAKAFQRVVPDDGGDVGTDSSVRGRPEDHEWTSRCLLSLDGENALLIDSRLVLTTPENWQRNLWSREIADGKDLKKVDLGARALSTPNSFALLVSCTSEDRSNRPLQLSVAVTAQGEARTDDGARRQDLADIGVRAAQLADAETGCKPAEALPKTAPEVK
ncbi:hypothetical protein ACFQVC_03625 [Streptomyces monticola]|uniref:DUF3558 domain-containing protein n=1 Tax=Streptomyces monticola TaxID=2666263 RepID=A0ABW2JCN8_9ACTN